MEGLEIWVSLWGSGCGCVEVGVGVRRRVGV